MSCSRPNPPWAALLLLLLTACGGAAPQPVAGPSSAAPSPSQSAPVTEEAVCSGAAPRPLRASAGRDLPDVKHGPVTAVRIRGDEGHEGAVKQAISVQVGAPLDRAVIRRDIEKLWALGLFADIAVRARKTKAGLELSYQLEARPKTGRLFLRGVELLPQHVLDDAVQLRTGEPYDPQQLEWTLLSLGEALQAVGHRFVKLEAHQLRDGVQHLCIEVTPGPKVTIEKWSYEGAKRFTEAELRRVVDTRDGTVNVSGGVFRPELWTTESLRLLAHYYDYGYVEAQVGEPRVDTSEDRTRLTVTVPIEEGREYRVGKVTFSGGALVSGQNYGSAVEQKSGEIFSRTKAMADMARLREFQQSVGSWSPDIEVTPITQVHRDRGLVDIEYQIQ